MVSFSAHLSIFLLAMLSVLGLKTICYSHEVQENTTICRFTLYSVFIGLLRDLFLHIMYSCLDASIKIPWGQS